MSVFLYPSPALRIKSRNLKLAWQVWTTLLIPSATLPFFHCPLLTSVQSRSFSSLERPCSLVFRLLVMLFLLLTVGPPSPTCLANLDSFLKSQLIVLSLRSPGAELYAACLASRALTSSPSQTPCIPFASSVAAGAFCFPFLAFGI